MKTSNILSTSTFTRRIRLAALLVTISTCLAAQAEITIEKRGNPTWEPTGAFISSLESPDIADLSSKQGERLLFSEVLANSHVIQDNFEFGYLPTEAHGGPYGREFQEAVAAFGGIDTDVVLSADVREPNSIFRGITLVPSNNAPEGSSFPHGDEVPVIPNDIFPIKVSYDQETYNGRVVLSDKELEIPALTDYGVITDLDGNERDYTGFSWTHIHLPWGVFWPSDRSLDRIPGNYEGVFRYRDRENNGWDVTFSYTAKSPTGILGDLDYDSLFSMGDLSVLVHNVALGSTNDRLDLNEDGSVDTGDVHFWVTDLYETVVGDSNLDDEVNFEDFLNLSTNFGQPGGWKDGDFNADGLVQFADFLLLSDNFGHGTDVATQSVPEPNSTSLLILGLIGLSRFRRRSACVQSTSSKSSISARQSIQAERCFANLDHSCPAYFVCLLLLGAFPTVCLSQIERREYGEGVVTRMVIPGTEDITPGPNVDLSGWNTDDRNLRGANLSADWLPYREGEVFDLTGADFGKSWLDNAAFGQYPSSTPPAYVPTTNLNDANFADASLMGAQFIRANLTNANLSGANLTDAALGATLTGANLTDAIVTGTQFLVTDWLTWVSSTGFTPEQLYSTRSYREKDLPGTSYSGDLSGWNFRQQNLSGARFELVDLSDADLSQANLSGTRFIGGNDLSGADLSGADMTNSYVSVRDIDGANLSNTRLINAYFNLVDLNSFDGKANLAGANLKNTYLEDLEAETWEFSADTVYNQWTLLPVDPVAAGLTFEPSPVGDFDANNVVDKQDYEMLEQFVGGDVWPRGLWLDRMFDLNEDERVNQHDLNMWITDVKQATPGDADLNGEVAFSDFLILSENFGGPAGWTSGDFDHNGEVQFADFLILSENFGNSSLKTASVPEPSALELGWFGLFAMMRFRKRITRRMYTWARDRKTGAVLESLEHRNMLTAIGFATHEVDVSTNANAPSVVIAADIDGDDDQDVVVASSLDHRLAWHENTDSQGSFGKHHVVTTLGTYFPRSLAVADLDGDGDLDLVATSHRGSRSPERIVSWHENLDGKGQFGGLQLLDTSSSELKPGTQTMEVADVDRDGHLDILVVTTGGIFNKAKDSQKRS